MFNLKSIQFVIAMVRLVILILKQAMMALYNATKSTIDTFFMGVWPGMTEKQLDYIEETLHKFKDKAPKG